MTPAIRGNVDARGALEQYNFIIHQIETLTKTSSRLILTPELIRQLHSLGLGPHIADAGKFRTVEVAVVDSPHKPPSPNHIAQELSSLCEYVNNFWEQQNAVHLAAFVLWKLNWIHPFEDGNGRTARSLSYLVLSVKLGTVLPGVPTIPEQLRYHRGRYFDALQAADVAFKERHEIDVSSLEKMLHDMLLHQLKNVPGLSVEDEKRLLEIIDRRVRRVPDTLRLARFGAKNVAQRLWAINDYLILQVGPPSDLKQAEAMHAEFGQPFPRLLAEGDSGAAIRIRDDQEGIVLRGLSYDASRSYAIVFDPSAAAILERPDLHWNRQDAAGHPTHWKLHGALYIMRLGRKIAAEQAPDIFDFLLARHMSTEAQCGP
jgi:hypothetical protein